MTKCFAKLIGACALAAVPAVVAQAQLANGLVNKPRVFNGWPTSTLTMSNNNSVSGGTATIDDRNATGGAGVNRHDVLLSGDHGATPMTLSIDTPFSISATLNLTDNSNAPRKEAGIRINAPVTGDALFIINSDAGEIVSFGGGMPFHLFGSNSGGNGYTPGTPIRLSLTYTPGAGGTTGANPASVDLAVTYAGLNGGSTVDTGPLAWSNVEGGPTSFQVGVYTQWGPSDANDFDHLNVTNLNANVVPEPASAGLVALGALGFLARRRGARIG